MSGFFAYRKKFGARTSPEFTRAAFRTLVFFLVVVPTSPLVAQPFDYKFEHISTSHGLSHSTVVDVIQDRDGFIWIGTVDGKLVWKHFVEPPGGT